MRIAGVVLLALSLQAQSPSLDLAAVRSITPQTPVDVQIAIAKSAGPPVSAAATIYVLGTHGYTRAQQGTNGFTCLIDQNQPDVIAPECFDAAGAPTIEAIMFVAAERARGVSEAEIRTAVKDRYERGQFVPPARPGIVYMLSDYNYLADPDTHQITHFPPHLMFYAPFLKATDVGSGPGAPFLTDPGQADNLMVVIPASSHPH